MSWKYLARFAKVSAEKRAPTARGYFGGKLSAGGRSPTSHCRKNSPEIGCAAFLRETFTRFILYFFITLFLTACSNSPTVQDSNGNSIHLKNYRGKWVLINYWASWCAPCMHEMPALNHLYQNYKNQIVILGVNFDGAANDQLRIMQKRFSITYPLLSQFPITTLKAPTVEVVPTTFVIDPNGKLSTVIKGPQTEQQFIELLHLQG